ncbi:hypothetical protein TPHA_0A04650 [Tetrapisispora phaffii CBS 4417]|uniref:SUN domain-containing protein n=1 Tax=Tetrapisispora phaffii (strain ATCC 24235 / CBS 4417 / NBRC 1672 / NRRL Y-8282 / UCD 70-5) TaxID=1071381 RepID=G8BNR0_TETPH|nr:hypothetical protein TPHA_0A04650 [Tetrapisispora phaffii CBS 4417]CCE61538.1 hypothetical protein TPHA_0A04650 [Tetrapisispora phaffii CBS 4417]
MSSDKKVSDDRKSRIDEDRYLPLNSSLHEHKDLLIEKMNRSNFGRDYEGHGEFSREGRSVVDRGMIMHDSEVDDNNDTDYDNFKKKILSNGSLNSNYISVDDDDWIDDLGSYSETREGLSNDEANESFIEDGDDDDYDYDYDYDDDEDYEILTNSNGILDNHRDSKGGSKGLFRTWALVTIVFVVFSTLLSKVVLPTSISSASNIPSGNVQRQINHLYNMVNTQNDKIQTDLDKTIKIVITQFEKKIKSILPKNILDFQSQLELLNTKVNKMNENQRTEKIINNQMNTEFSMKNLTIIQDLLTNQLNNTLPDKIPVIINNSTSMLMIPEIHNYLKDIISGIITTLESNSTNILQGNMTTNLGMQQEGFLPDLNGYIKEILKDELQYIDKDYFVQELNRKLQLNKHEIFEEFTEKLSDLKISSNSHYHYNDMTSDKYSDILLRKMINRIYNANQHQWEDDLDFATFAQGTRLLNHLTSKTWKKGTQNTPLELLSNTINNSVYWQCDSTKDCRWAIRFSEPIYLFRLSYLHGRLKNNVHMMNSAPKKISIYVKLANGNDLIKTFKKVAKTYKQGQSLNEDSSYIKIGQYDYDLTDPKVKQDFLLPSWYIKLRPLVHSMVFEINENYGNKDFTSLKKFLIKAVTKQDLEITTNNEFPYKLGNVPEYNADNYVIASSDTGSSHHLMNQQLRNVQDDRNDGFKNLADNENSKIPSFGQDELDI